MAIAHGEVKITGGARTDSRADVRLSLIASPELNATLEELAERSHSTKSDVLRKAVALFDVASAAKQNGQKIGILDQDDKLVKEIVGL